MSTLSVVMGNYNKAGFVENALDSVLKQSYPPTEIVLVDDCSTDGSRDTLQDYARRFPKIRLLLNEQNMGAIITYNRAVEACSGEYLYMMGCDDNIFPGFFEKSLRLLEQHPQAALCASDPAQFFEKNGVFLENRLAWSDTPRYFNPLEFAECLQGWYIPAHPTIVRRKLYIETGMHLAELKWHSDWFFWLVLAFRYGICYIPEPLAVIRVAGGSYSGSRSDWNEQRGVLVNLLKKLKSPEYRELIPFFVRGSVMTHFGDEIVRAVMSEPDLWDAETMMLIQAPLWDFARRMRETADSRQRSFEKNATEASAAAAFELVEAALKSRRPSEAQKILAALSRKFPDNLRIQNAVMHVKEMVKPIA